MQDTPQPLGLLPAGSHPFGLPEVTLPSQASQHQLQSNRFLWPSTLVPSERLVSSCAARRVDLVQLTPLANPAATPASTGGNPNPLANVLHTYLPLRVCFSGIPSCDRDLN